MPRPVSIRLGDRTIWLVPAADVESWSEDAAHDVLRGAAAQWPARESLLRLSDATLGPGDDLEAALVHLGEAFDRGRLLAVRLPDENAGLAQPGRGTNAWDDAPRLSDLTDDDADDTDDDDRRTDPHDPAVPGGTDPWGGGGRGDVDDPSVTFVAFAVFDQHGRPLGGHARCRVDAEAHASTLDGEVVEIRPIAAQATVTLELSELAPTSA